MQIVLDVNDTLSDLAPLGPLLASRGAPAGTAGAWFAGVLRDGFALSLHHRAPAFADLARQGLARELQGLEQLTGPVEAVVEEVIEAMGRLEVHPDVGPGLRALAGAGHRLATLTNGAVATSQGLLERSDLADVVTRLLSVEGLGVWKRHPEAYAHGATELGLPATELMLVAVHPWDLDGAARAGLRTAWIDRDGAPWPSSFQEPELRASGFVELAELLGEA